MFTKRFAELKPYVPGEQPKDRTYIKLNANENPYPPSPEVTRVLREFDASQLRLYPDPDSNELRVAIARMLGSGFHRANDASAKLRRIKYPERGKLAVAMRAHGAVPSYPPTVAGGAKGPSFYWKYLEHGTAKMPARPFFAPALEEKAEEVHQAVADELKEKLGL